jgi:2-keto-4-pentenoate hydratase/2-oxohepta-3-ene-1,7-dioic acid hydratase in catechol pathway
MKLGTMLVDTGERVFAVDGAEAVDLVAAIGKDGGAPRSLIQVAADPARFAAAIGAAIASGAGRIPLDRIVLAPPIPRPGKVLCVALNNSANIDRIISGPRHPAFFPKPATSLIGSGAAIRLRPEYGRVHPEPELAVVVGSGGRDIPRDRALEYVFGYTIMNDLTSPTMRAEDTFHYRAIHPAPEGPEGVRYVDTWVSYPGRYKGSDGFGPVGPWVVTADEIADPHALTVRCEHQGRLVTEDSTANLFYTVADVLSFASRFMTLEPGDLIAMGTALKRSAGGGAVQNVDLNRLGGPITVSIDGIGTLSNPVETA